MTDNRKTLQRLISRRNAAYNQRTAAFLSRGALLTKAEEAGRTTLTKAEERTFAGHSLTIRRLGEEIAELDRRIAAQHDRKRDDDEDQDEEDERR